MPAMRELVSALVKLTNALTAVVEGHDDRRLIAAQLVWSEKHTRKLEQLAAALKKLDAQTPPKL